MALWKSDRRLWLDGSRTKVVEEGDPEAAFLFCIAGEEILESEAAKVGLVKSEAKPAEKAAPKPSKPKEA